MKHRAKAGMGRPRNQGHRWDYHSSRCHMCGYETWALPSRVAWVAALHTKRCERATDDERRQFRTTGRWPRAKAP